MPLHLQIDILLIVGSISFCLILAIVGTYLRRDPEGIPPVPLFPGSNFPNFIAQFYTAFFTITFGMASVAQCMEPAAPEAQMDILNLISSAIIQTALYVPFLIIYFTLPARNLPIISTGKKIGLMFAGLAVLLLASQAMELSGFTRLLIEYTQCPEQQDVVDNMANGPLSVKLVMVIMVVIVAPVTEECCFRGFIYNILKQKSNIFWAALASSVLFSAVHASLAQFVPLFLFGLVQCFFYEKTRTLWMPVIFHMLFNGISSIAILLM